MRALLEIFWEPKQGSSAEEYEDAFFPDRAGLVIGESLRFAVADGATESSFSKTWAQLLVRGYCKHWIGGNDPEEGLARLGKIWQRGIENKPLPWHAQHKLHEGAHAALAGLEMFEPQNSGPGTWSAHAVGDCNLFQISGRSMVTSFPITDAVEFGSRPVLLSSMATRNQDAIKAAVSATGTWEVGDVFLLMSDALAAWFLGEEQAGNDPWISARRIGTGQAEYHFPTFISELRSSKELRNDDVTLVRIALV